MAECCMACGATRPIVSSQSYNRSTLWCKQRFPASPAFTSSPLPCFTDLQSVFKFHPPSSIHRPSVLILTSSLTSTPLASIHRPSVSFNASSLIPPPRRASQTFSLNLWFPWVWKSARYSSVLGGFAFGCHSEMQAFICSESTCNFTTVFDDPSFRAKGFLQHK